MPYRISGTDITKKTPVSRRFFYLPFGGSPRNAAMLQLRSPITSVRLASLFSMRTNRNQLSIMGKPKSLMKLKSSEASMSRPRSSVFHGVQGGGTQSSAHRFHQVAPGSIKDVVVHDGLHGGVDFRLADVFLRFLYVEDDFFANGVFKDQVQVSIRRPNLQK